MITIRPYRPGDEAALYDVCLRTGLHGLDASGLYSDPRLLGNVYVGPYLELQPRFAFVVDDGERPRGYVLGASDTREFEDACERTWWPRLREEYPLDGTPADAPERWLVEHIHNPPRTPAEIVEAYPSHLHIDLLPEAQGAGWGRRLMRALFAALAEAGSPGVHLGVSKENPGAIAFYRRLGFEELRDLPHSLVLAHPLA
ncbi:GNAT family N-acetyltransferase [Bailinhaonella thermotolerans]|uniref:N-acetyltransferase n=1 Tax=Bailinhaonella thermotolerans TaxID=1070861 RepID=A0A3A4B3J9_9ACTN|nr:N-acetyltransferase [Bailinhaonella thermotolerans]RJL32755.1 N-acetyltransferase [Bailinhaonella thermotolerans]